MHPKDLKYTKTHEWVRIEKDIGTVGIAEYASKQLADLVYIELFSKGEKLTQGSVFGSIESVKAVSELTSPLSGEVIEVHKELSQKLDLISNDPYGEGWLIKIKLGNKDELKNLMDYQQYGELVKRKEEQE